MNWIVKALGVLGMFAGFVVGAGGELGGWFTFVGGCILYAAAHVVEEIRDMKR